LKGTTAGRSAEAQKIWGAKQAYLGLGTLLTAAAAMSIDASPMEGFDPAGYKEVLGMEDHTPVVIAAVGYRSEEDSTQHHVKVRKPADQFFETI
jgi:nitroreductase